MKLRWIDCLEMSVTIALGSGNLSQALMDGNLRKLMFSQGWFWQLGIALGVTSAVALSGNQALAQSNIVPDNTLGVGENSVVGDDQNLPNVEVIRGGAQRGQNLFHSFLEFNVALGRGAYFESPDAAIQNILARVTGSNPSQILGTLGTFETVGGAPAPSNANLFLINPNGIIFGEDSKLDVGGSFVATTANAVGLGDTGRFSASEPDTSNLLNINPDVFFFNRLSNQAEIVNRSIATTPVLGGFINDELPLLSGLQVIEGKSLLLLGGDVSLDGGALLAPGGRVELGGLSEPGTVELNTDGNNLSLSFPDDLARADVLLNGAFIGTQAGGGGNIVINAQTVDILGGSFLFTGIAPGNGSVDSRAGDIKINATGTITVSESSFIFNIVSGIGTAGDIEINTADTVTVSESSFITNAVLGTGTAGDIEINARDTVNVSESSFIANTVLANGTGTAGDIKISTNFLEVTNGATMFATLIGEGNAGDVIIRASDTVRFDSVSSNGLPSAILSGVNSGAIGNGGEIKIITGSLEVTNGAALNTVTGGEGNAGDVRIRASDTVRFDGVGNNRVSGVFSAVFSGAIGNAGEIEISTNSLEVTNGASLNTSTLGVGNAGRVKIRATDTVRFDGVSSNGVSSGIFSFVFRRAVGNAGEIEISTNSLEVTNGAQLLASTLGEGNGGVIQISTGSLSLNDALISSESLGTGGAGDITIDTRQNLETNRSSITTSTLSGDGGDITLQVGDLLLVRDNTKISTSAGVAGAGGNGGDITIDADFVIGVPREDSDITANAFNGKGGNIIITTQGIFGLQFRDRLTPLSDITASSEFGLDGEFQLNLLSPIDVAQSIVDLPSNLVDATKLIDRRCTPGDPFRQSSFHITGRGGIPQNPTQMLDADATVSNWVTLDSEVESGNKVDTNPISTTPQRIIEAQGIVRTPDGQLYLAAEVPTVTPHGEWIPAVDCLSNEY